MRPTLTPELLAGVRNRTSATLERIEKGYDIDLAGDRQLLSDLDGVKADARNLLGDEHYGGAAGPIVRAIDGIMSRASEDGIIPGKSAASLWHKGSALDRLTDSANRDTANLALRAQQAVRGALNRQLPPAEAQVYSAARHAWRDLRIVEKSLRPGETQLNPGRFVTQVNRRFPGHASQPGGPPVLQLARAVGETFPTSGENLSQQLVRRVLGHLVGGGLGGAVGGWPGAAVGTVTGHMVLDRLARLRLASPDAATFIKGALPQTPFVPPALSALMQRAPAAAAPALSYQGVR